MGPAGDFDPRVEVTVSRGYRLGSKALPGRAQEVAKGVSPPGLTIRPILMNDCQRRALAGMMGPVSTRVLAHRGASRVEHENTIAAFRRAADMGSHAAELDVRRTADGVLVVHHNPDLADGRLIRDTASTDLPDHVPTLDSALDACSPMWVNVEIKNDPSEPDFDPTEDIAEATVRCLQRRSEPSTNWLISSFRRETIDRCRLVDPSIPTAWLTPAVESEQMEPVLSSLSDSGHSALHPWVGLLTKDLVDACHRHGLAINTWTCDDPERMAELISWSVDGICTNVPDVALQVLNKF